MSVTFGKKEKLKSKKEITLLFSEGKSVSAYPIRLIYSKKSQKDLPLIKAGVSVGKRNFKRAVDRNHIKRLLRESYRKNKYLVTEKNTDYFSFLFLYTGKEIPDYAFLESKMKKVLLKFVEQEMSH
ncbi:ribonuclease P protein component [Aquimarina sp. TRL1]|uniref:ribonuclease P protein component n=1 Tax=Aquimarina sp. (strain TRL1) TaxID=2736252 RepID=UPI00158DC6B9|nr:ribonuclease P protein component [Aquimarina sp. TRL1]QKX04673.1 ribonuclease P protein component [Aquimarina sp. TRL1]